MNNENELDRSFSRRVESRLLTSTLLPFLSAFVFVDLGVLLHFPHPCLSPQVSRKEPFHLLTLHGFIKDQLEAIFDECVFSEGELASTGPAFRRREEGINTQTHGVFD
jgi:hypothetical protein